MDGDIASKVMNNKILSIGILIVALGVLAGMGGKSLGGLSQTFVVLGGLMLGLGIIIDKRKHKHRRRF